MTFWGSLRFRPKTLSFFRCINSTINHPTMTQPQAHLRSLYRSILRELPSRPLTAPPSPLHSRIRASFTEPARDPSPEYSLRQRQQAEQFIQYVKAQRNYITLLERYNPGMTMDDEDRIRLTARRVGMNLPIEFQMGKQPGE
jgi:ATP synthase assembly factor FMC1, mitochondrial